MPGEPANDFFALIDSLDAIGRIKIETACTTIRLAPGETVYAANDPADAVYIVASGVVEAFTQSPDGSQTRSLAIMERGTFFGELAVLTGQPRLAAVRARQAVKLFRFDREKFLKLMDTVPQFGNFFCRSLALRLHKTSTEAHHHVFAVDLSGNLQRFDLLTIFQAVSGMHHTGELSLNDRANEPIGSFFFREGRVEQARFLHLLGLEAVWQGFMQSATDGTFVFRLMSEPSRPSTGEPLIEMESTKLIMEGVSRRDDFNAVEADLRAMNVRLGRRVDALAWNDAETAPLAGRIWELIGNRPQTLGSIWRRLNYSALTFLHVVEDLVDAGRAELLPEETVPPAA
jgi:hypothetical protein